MSYTFLTKPINEFSAEELRDFYQVTLIPQFEDSGIDSCSGELLEECFKRSIELLLAK